jgi:nicotinate-nucleotide adenylyltransferase
LRLGVLGGTFDPVHLGHLVIGEIAREQLKLDRVVFIPTGHSWRKPDRVITDGEHRLAMLRLAAVGNPAFEVSSLEVDRPGPSSTDVTREALAAENPAAELYFILGRDALADLPHWRNPKRIVELATLAVADRPSGETPLADEPLLPGLEARLVWLTMPVVGISATDIRRRVAARFGTRRRTPLRTTYGSTGCTWSKKLETAHDWFVATTPRRLEARHLCTGAPLRAERRPD